VTGFFIKGDIAWHSKPYDRASAPKRWPTLINQNHDGAKAVVADLGDASAMRFSSAISSPAKSASALAATLSLITFLTSLVAAPMRTATYKPSANPATKQKLTPNLRRNQTKIWRGAVIFIFRQSRRTPRPLSRVKKIVFGQKMS